MTGPDLDPADAVHIPRWLGELADAQNRGEFLLETVDVRRTPRVDLTPEEAAEVEAYVRAKWVEPSQEGGT